MSALRFEFLGVGSKTGACAKAFRQHDSSVNSHSIDEESRPNVKQSIKPRSAEVKFIGEGIIQWPNVAGQKEESWVKKTKSSSHHPLYQSTSHLCKVEPIEAYPELLSRCRRWLQMDNWRNRRKSCRCSTDLKRTNEIVNVGECC